jgi:hypothetical protein
MLYSAATKSEESRTLHPLYFFFEKHYLVLFGYYFSVSARFRPLLFFTAVHGRRYALAG